MLTTLDNGLRILHCAAQTPVAYCGFIVDAGTRDEVGFPMSAPVDGAMGQETLPYQAGLAHFVEHMIFKGTRRRDSWHINRRMEAVGGELNAYTTKEDTTLYCALLPRDFDRACELLCDLVCNATMPQHELEKERDVVIDEINSYLDTPSELIYDEFENRLFAGHPLGHNILGTAQHIRTYTSADCLRFVQRLYCPERMVFFYYGPADESQVVRRVARWFTMPSKASQSLLRPGGTSEAAKQKGTYTLTMHTHQAHVLLGAQAYPLGHPDAAVLALLSNILGGPGMNSRLGIELRERRGLVYTVESSVTAFTDTGYMSIYFGCDHDDVDRCLRLCRRELEHLCTTPLTPRQLAAAQQQLKGQTGIAAANLENTALAAARSQLRLGYVETLEEVCARIDAVTPEALQHTARTLLTPEALRCVVIH